MTIRAFIEEIKSFDGKWIHHKSLEPLSTLA